MTSMVKVKHQIIYGSREKGNTRIPRVQHILAFSVVRSTIFTVLGFDTKG